MEMIKKGKEIRASLRPNSKQSPLKRRFWKDVIVDETPGGYQIMLDKRPVRTPTKAIITVPLSKPHLAHSIAIEWDHLESAQQALKNYRIPMTSIVARAQDLAEAEAGGDESIRKNIIRVMMRYLDTDTLLCWAPERSASDAVNLEQRGETKESLRSIQMRTAQPIIAFLKSTVWPGVDIRPGLDEGSIMPSKQSDLTRGVIEGWMSGLPPFELAALERAALATKSILVAARLVIEWSEEFRHLQREGTERFDIERAAEAATQEVKWQTGMWGEVEDTHDVENEDLRQQLGSAILLISGSR